MSRFLWLPAALVFVLSSLVSADRSAGAGEGPASPSTELTAHEISALIDNLEDSSYASRQAATARLAEFGLEAITQLEVAAGAGSREVASRALVILKRHFQSGDESSRAAARDALERLASSTDVGTSQRARDILNPPPPPVASNRWGPRPPIPPPAPVQPGGNNAVRAAFGLAGGIRRVSVSDLGGRKTIEIDDRERLIRIAEQPGGRFEAQVTDKQVVANPTRRIEAKDFEELRRKDADVARLYEQYRNLNERAAAAPPLQPPLGAPIRPMMTPAEGMRTQIQSLDAILSRYRQRARTDPNAERMVQALEQTKARLEAALPGLAR